MVREIVIDGKVVRFRATAALTRLYRIRFGGDILQDLIKLRSAYVHVLGGDDLKDLMDGKEELTEEQAVKVFSALDLELFENVSYIMAKHAEPEAVPSSVEEWLEQFDVFSIYIILPELLSLWVENMQTQVESKKKLGAVVGN